MQLSKAQFAHSPPLTGDDGAVTRTAEQRHPDERRDYHPGCPFFRSGSLQHRTLALNDREPDDSGMSEPIIDAWIQHPTAQFIAHDMFASLRRWMRLEVIPDEIPIELTLNALDAAGVTKALTSAWWGPDGPLLSNDEVARTVSAHPNRLVGIGSVNLHRPMDAVRELRRSVTELGFVGVRQLPWLWGLPPNDRRYYPIYAECVELGVPFCLQVGHAGPLRPSEPGRPIPYLDEVACEFPELRIVGGHIGYPWTDEMISLATKYENVYIDTSAYTPERYPEALVRFMKGPGCRKVLFGSNFPMIQPAKCASQLDSLGLSDEVRRLFLWENAVKVFELDL